MNQGQRSEPIQPIREGTAYAALRESRHWTVFPWIEREIERAAPASLLDFGGGDGALLKGLRPLVGSAAYYDPSPVMRGVAEAALEGSDVTVAGDLAELGGRRFAAITFSAVWMVLASRDQCVEALSWMCGHLEPDGMILFAVTHPCFRDDDFTSITTDFDPADYQVAGAPFQLVLRDGDRKVPLSDFHWSLSMMFEQVRAAGLWVDELIEFGDVDSAGIPTPGPVPWLAGTLRPRPR